MKAQVSVPLSVAWISDFPVELLSDTPEAIRRLPKPHAMTWLRVLAKELQAETEVRLSVVVLRKGITRDVVFERGGITFHVLKTPGGLRAPSLFWVDTIIIRRTLRSLRPSIVHAWGTEKGAALVASRLRTPSLVTIQGLLGWYKELIPLNKYEWFMARLERTSLRRARDVTTESNFALKYLEVRYPNAAIHQVEHAPDWRFHKLQRAPEHDPVRFLYVGTIGYRKGVDLLLKAFSRLLSEMKFKLVLVGGSRDHPFIRNSESNLREELWRHIEFKPNLDAEEVAAEMTRATILVLPTRADTSPNVVKEAVVAGLPVVASDVGGIPDYVLPGENGFLFLSGELEGLVHALRSAVAHPLFSKGRVEQKSIGRLRDYLSPARMSRLFQDIYHLSVKRGQDERCLP